MIAMNSELCPCYAVFGSADLPKPALCPDQKSGGPDVGERAVLRMVWYQYCRLVNLGFGALNS